MKLKVLVDNNTIIDDYYLGEPALSFYLEEEDNRILFDTGYSDIFLTNAEKMKIDLSKLNYLVLSHGHNDHLGGLAYLKDKDLSKIKLVAHPDVFKKRRYQGLDISSPVELEELKVEQFIDGTNLVKLSDKLWFLGHIERTTTFENSPVGFLTEDDSPDYLVDDSALVYLAKDGLFIITACSHSGICNIVEYAKKVTGINDIKGIIGGFHLLLDNKQLTETINYLKQQNIADLYPCHCISLYAKHRMYEVGKVHEVGVGLDLTID